MGWRALLRRVARGFSPPRPRARSGATLGANRKAFYSYYPPRIAAGSDFPEESDNPFFGLHAAVTRTDHEGRPTGGWHPEQAMTLIEAFRAFTLDAAYAQHQEKTVGSLEPGKWADFILIDRDLFQIPPADIWKIKVEQTWVGGRRVY